MPSRATGSRIAALVFGVLLGSAGSAPAQSDLRCFKINDPLKLKGTVDFNSQQAGLEAGCIIKKGAFFCVPGTTTVVEAKEGKNPVTVLPVTGSELQDNRICYKLKCEGTPPPAGATDIFGGRTLERKSTGLLCTAALDGILNPSCTIDADCDDADPCNGFEQCENFLCEPGTPIGCLPEDIVFTVPYENAPLPAMHDVAAEPELQDIDAYLLLDRSGSMFAEVTNIKNNFAAAMNNLRCPPEGTGTPESCIPGLWAGAGTIGYAGAGGSPYLHVADVQPNPNVSALPTTEPGGCCNEPILLDAWASITGLGSAAAVSSFGAGCTVTDAIPDRASCGSSPAVLAGYGATGYPCFRSTALPVLMIATDEAPSQTQNCPTIVNTAAAAVAESTRIVGLVGSSAAAQTRLDLESLATQTAAVDMANNPIVFDGFDANATTALQNALSTLHASPIDTRAAIHDDPDDAVDTTSAFLDRVETLQLGTGECMAGLPEQDSDGDTFNDEYAFLVQGTPVCWRVQAKSNTSVAATAAPQVFEATLRVEGARRAAMGAERRVLFVVPPAP